MGLQDLHLVYLHYSGAQQCLVFEVLPTTRVRLLRSRRVLLAVEAVLRDLALEEDLPASVEVRPYAVAGELHEPLVFLNGVAS